MDKHEERLERWDGIKHKINEEQFEEMLEKRERDLYQGAEVDGALKIMEILDEFYDKLESAINIQGHSGLSFAMLASICKSFHEIGDIVENC